MANQKINSSQIQDQEAWQTPTFQNSWVDYGGSFATAGYMKDTLGFVHIKGVVKSGSLGTIFTLPVGYRPATNILLPIMSNGVLGLMQVDSAGAVALNSGSNVYACLDAVFKVDQ